MEFNQVIKERRSIRRYTTQKVEEKKIVALIEAAQLAPTWKNSQTGRYYVLREEASLKEFIEACLPPFNKENVKDAPVIIVTTFKKDVSGFDKEANAVNEVGNGWGYYDLGLQNQNLVLKAVDLGLDTLIMGIRDENAIRAFLKVPEDEIIVSVISVGYRNINPDMPKRKALEDIIKWY